MIPTSVVRRSSLIISIFALAACSSVSNFIEDKKVDYKTSATQKVRTLEVPPDLSRLPRDDRYDIPDKGAVATASVYNAQRASEAASPSAANANGDVLPQVKEAHIERAGGQRWLVVDKGVDVLYPVVKEFWQDNGFEIKIDSPATGIMETEWNENRAKLPLDFVRSTIGKFLDSAYSTGERDKFRTRFERRPDGSTEIYISHRGMQEVLTGAQKDQTMWTERPSDPELEAEFLNRLLLRLGVDKDKSRAIVDASAVKPGPFGQASVEATRSHLVTASGAPSYLEVNDPFDRAWRRVGLALDRVNFTVEDRDRTQGVYFVRYVDPQAGEEKNKPGFLTRMFSSSEASKIAAQYRIQVREQPGSGVTRVSIFDKDGAPEVGEVGTKILALLNDQLK